MSIHDNITTDTCPAAYLLIQTLYYGSFRQELR
ncbi:hypothetical protein BZ17_2789 [Yersinia pseudotuberculosis IP 32953]|uniref:Uncharacterized protein n=1 Tax=Yersinia pseudotuberculosis TaxID=633 RepID=A0A380Q2V4_YERPU|nr:hypothetical protein DJ40_2599 [Yersinia pseudotuberculosis]AJJ56572.1 hypothetical protein BZ17_2789 [Yersinia pseudotuberculosis IP 32953]AJK16495.1 hypothetical protein BZ19_3284 [Yersinia pseudotuberculosis str. PA3606]AJJ08119.1 hypothetical protein BZ20_2298 [Yersinia pseudotuberculosis]AJJ72301.1 hypothetical protein BZ23_3421 [Yersinia pseudotuberculosis]